MNFLRHLWRTDRPLTATGLLNLAALLVFLVGLSLDPRVITGAPAWLKPAKFAVSIALFTFTLAWIFTYLGDWPRTRRVAGWITAVALNLELAIISLQAFRGTTSHFNFRTPFDSVLWTTMGLAIVVQTLAAAAVAAALWRQSFSDRSLGWALRLGLSISVLGATAGGLMTRPTEAQLAALRAGAPVSAIGAHTVGAPDGGPGLRGTNWSLEHGDLRIPHFLGLHAMQALPLLAILFRRRRWTETASVRMTFVAAASYLGLFSILLFQALRGQSVIDPDAATLTALTIWAAFTAAAAWIAVARRSAVTARIA